MFINNVGKKPSDAMYHRLFVLLLCGLTFAAGLLSGCRKPEPVVLSLYCSDTFWEVMKEQTRVFQTVYGISVIMYPIRPQNTEDEPVEAQQTNRRAPALWRNRPVPNTEFLKEDFSTLNAEVEERIRSIPQQGFADIYFSDSVPEQEYVQNLMLVMREYPVCTLKMGLLVPQGNPNGIESLQDAVTKKQRIGLTNASQDGMGAAARRALAKVPASVAVTEEVQNQIAVFDNHEELLNALETKQIDTALVWETINIKGFLLKKYYDEYRERFDAPILEILRRDDVEQYRRMGVELYTTLLKEKDFTEFLPLQNEESYALDVPLLSLSTTRHDGQTRRFADFLISPIGQEIFKKHGFIPKIP